MRSLIVAALLMILAERAQAQSLCPAKITNEGSVKITTSQVARLVVRLGDPPRTRVTLSIDNARGNHHELIWDPVVRDGLQKWIDLEADEWRLTASADYERVEADNMVVTYGTIFSSADPAQTTVVTSGGYQELYWRAVRSAQQGDVVFIGENMVSAWPPAEDNKAQRGLGMPTLIGSCTGPLVELSKLHLDRRKVVAASVARGLLDASVPKAVTETLSLLADIAIERARSTAVGVIRDKVIEPLCELKRGRFALRPSGELLLPRTCDLLRQLRIEDALASGHVLMRAVELDVREIIPAIVEQSGFLDQQSMELVTMALRFLSRLSDGDTDGIIEIDYVIALLDQVPWSSGFEQSVPLLQAWMDSLSLTSKQVATQQAALVEYSLPEDFDLKEKPYPWRQFEECTVKQLDETRFERRLPNPCATRIAQHFLNSHTDWLERGVKAKLFTIREAFTSLSMELRARRPFTSWFAQDWVDGLRIKVGALPTGTPIYPTIDQAISKLGDEATEAIATGCAVRLIVGSAKWCSGRAECTASEVAEILKAPEKTFLPASSLPDALCWRSATEYRKPADMQRYLDIAARLVTFLNPASEGEVRARMLAVTRWMFDVAVAALGKNRTLTKIQEVAFQLSERDYVSALTGMFTLARDVKCRKVGACSLPEETTRVTELFGAFASYAQVYRETKSMDPKEANEARKKALISIIDSATDRERRGRAWILSLGSNVGFSNTWTNQIDLATGNPREIAVRVPLGLSLQLLPRGSEPARDGIQNVDNSRYFGVHFGVQLADLGQFVRTGDDDNLTWASFVAPGIEAGIMIGQPHRAVVISAHGSYVPSLTDDNHAAWRFGAAISYYVPFFDLN